MRVNTLTVDGGLSTENLNPESQQAGRRYSHFSHLPERGKMFTRASLCVFVQPNPGMGRSRAEGSGVLWLGCPAFVDGPVHGIAGLLGPRGNITSESLPRTCGDALSRVGPQAKHTSAFTRGCRFSGVYFSVWLAYLKTPVGGRLTFQVKTSTEPG